MTSEQTGTEQSPFQENNDSLFFFLRGVFFVGSVSWAVSVVMQISKIRSIAADMPSQIFPVMLCFLLYSLFILYLVKRFPDKKAVSYTAMMIMDCVFVTICISRTGQGNSNFYLGYNIFIAAYTLAIGSTCGAAMAIISSALYLSLYILNPDRYFVADFGARLGFMFLVFFVVASIGEKQKAGRARISENMEKIDELNRRLETSYSELMDEKESITAANRDKSLMLKKQSEITERRRSHISFSKELNAKKTVEDAILLFSRYMRSLLFIDGASIIIPGQEAGSAIVYNVSEKHVESNRIDFGCEALEALRNAPWHEIEWRRREPGESPPKMFLPLIPANFSAGIIRAMPISGGDIDEAGVYVLYHSSPLIFDEELMEEISLLSSHLGVDIEKIRYSTRLQELADTDGLTGVYNHRFFQESLDRELLRSIRYTRPLSVILFDIDHFKKLNDTLGHPAGDAVLRTLAKKVLASLRTIDIFARYGGEEFIIILPETPVDNAMILADRLRLIIEECEFDVGNDKNTSITVSMGLAGYPEHTEKQSLVEAADQALYRAKQGGRNRVMM